MFIIYIHIFFCVMVKGFFRIFKISLNILISISCCDRKKCENYSLQWKLFHQVTIRAFADKNEERKEEKVFF